eukprot:NODE_157_length_2618_cov_56.653562_g121_i0.p1 GENE.NODE_157_length_2618_cov_56.653562_g121_i0~~NODE_157_length_2618_cov_56.653562_g121_i0.p1  ORF type:complete len:841 (+),score=297.20 NODE_157_length_2618_cov_56.653562_g121_i0:153-2525(+)
MEEQQKCKDEIDAETMKHNMELRALDEQKELHLQEKKELEAQKAALEANKRKLEEDVVAADEAVRKAEDAGLSASKERLVEFMNTLLRRLELGNVADNNEEEEDPEPDLTSFRGRESARTHWFNARAEKFLKLHESREGQLQAEDGVLAERDAALEAERQKSLESDIAAMKTSFEAHRKLRTKHEEQRIAEEEDRMHQMHTAFEQVRSEQDAERQLQAEDFKNGNTKRKQRFELDDLPLLRQRCLEALPQTAAQDPVRRAAALSALDASVWEDFEMNETALEQIEEERANYRTEFARRQLLFIEEEWEELERDIVVDVGAADRVREVAALGGSEDEVQKAKHEAEAQASLRERQAAIRIHRQDETNKKLEKQAIDLEMGWDEQARKVQRAWRDREQARLRRLRDLLQDMRTEAALQEATRREDSALAAVSTAAREAARIAKIHEDRSNQTEEDAAAEAQAYRRVKKLQEVYQMEATKRQAEREKEKQKRKRAWDSQKNSIRSELVAAMKVRKENLRKAFERNEHRRETRARNQEKIWAGRSPELAEMERQQLFTDFELERQAERDRLDTSDLEDQDLLATFDRKVAELEARENADEANWNQRELNREKDWSLLIKSKTSELADAAKERIRRRLEASEKRSGQWLAAWESEREIYLTSERDLLRKRADMKNRNRLLRKRKDKQVDVDLQLTLHRTNLNQRKQDDIKLRSEYRRLAAVAGPNALPSTWAAGYKDAIGHPAPSGYLSFSPSNTTTNKALLPTPPLAATVANRTPRRHILGTPLGPGSVEGSRF